MKRLSCRMIVALLLCALLAQPLLCAETATPPGAKAKTTAKARTTAAKPRRAKAQPGPASAPAQPGLSQQELTAPYTADLPFGPPKPPQQPGEDNATRWDPVPAKPKPTAKNEDGSPLNLRLGREQVLDPLTGKELTRRPDPAGATESIKNLDLKGAVDKLGGKAEVQVDILKF